MKSTRLFVLSMILFSACSTPALPHELVKQYPSKIPYAVGAFAVVDIVILAVKDRDELAEGEAAVGYCSILAGIVGTAFAVHKATDESITHQDRSDATAIGVASVAAFTLGIALYQSAGKNLKKRSPSAPEKASVGHIVEVYPARVGLRISF